MKRCISVFAFVFLLFPMIQAHAAGPVSVEPATLSPDELFLLARDAVRVGDRARFGKIVPALKEHDLAVYIDYWLIRMNLGTVTPTAIKTFIQTNKDSFLAEKLRSDWLKYLGKQKRWVEFNAEYSALLQPDQEILCYAMQGKQKKRGDAFLKEAKSLWLTLADPPEACLPVLESLILEKRVQADDVWARIRYQFEVNKTEAARISMNYLPESQTPDDKTAQAVINKPLPWLLNLKENFSENQMGRELSVLAISRVARNDVRIAVEQLKRIEKKLGAGEQEWAWSQIAGQAALRHMRETLEWYDKAKKTALSDNLIEWKARAALRVRNWPVLRKIIEQMPERLSSQLVWIYWRGRIFREEGHVAEANALFGKIAGNPNFYSNLADEELGKLIVAPPRANPPTSEEMERASSNRGLRLSLALFRVGLRLEGVREWNWALRGMNDRELLAASQLALNAGVFDRAISAADRTKNEHDYTLRYLVPLSEQIRPAAKRLLLDDAWVYGLMRQESRFITDARSPVGASGLMQLMPKTARWVARKIGLKDYHPRQVNDTDTNVLLGTSYMRMVLDSLGDHPVLASAAYNAGPGRARKWRAGIPLEGAIYAETIPFDETRDYVKKVMSNTLYYALLFDGKPQSIRQRIGIILPAPKDEPRGEDLP